MPITLSKQYLNLADATGHIPRENFVLRVSIDFRRIFLCIFRPSQGEWIHFGREVEPGNPLNTPILQCMISVTESKKQCGHMLLISFL